MTTFETVLRSAFRAATVAVLLLSFSATGCVFSDSNGRAEARSKKSAPKQAKKTQSKRSTSARSSRSSSRPSSRSSAKSKREVSRRGGRGRPLSKAERRRAARQAKASRPAPPPPKPTLTPEQIEVRDRRHRAYGDMAHAYSLYDAGANARLAGNYADAIDKLNQSARLFNNANDYQHSGTSSTLESMVQFELGLAAEAVQDFGLARDSYQRCLLIRPTFTQASVRLVNMLARIGQGPLALAKAQEAVYANPADPRSHLLLALMFEKTGRVDLARVSRETAKSLLVAPTSPPVSDRTGDIDDAKLPITDKIDADGAEQSGKTADSDVMGDEEGEEEVPVP